MAIQVPPDHYANGYDTKERFCSYWYQIHQLTLLKPHSILEVGVGNRFVSKYLREKEFAITTLDIDKRLSPDLAASILNIPFKDCSFDVVSCYEVLEHLPYTYFYGALRELNRVSIRNVVLSVPDANWACRFYLHIPKVGEIKKILPLPLKAKKHVFEGQHYWEIGKRWYPLKRIFRDIENAGFMIEKTYRTFEIPFHRFFVLTKVRHSMFIIPPA